MTSKYFSGREGRYVFCDICGQAVYVKDAKRLTMETGRGGLIVCPNDADSIDFGLVPYVPTTERPVEWTRINHTNVTNSSPPLDYDTTTELGV